MQKVDLSRFEKFNAPNRIKRVVKGYNGSWDLPFFEAGKWDFVHSDWDS